MSMSNFPRGNSLLQNCFSLISSSQHCSRSASTHFPSSGKNLLQNCITTVLLNAMCRVLHLAYFLSGSLAYKLFNFSFLNSDPDKFRINNYSNLYRKLLIMTSWITRMMFRTGLVKIISGLELVIGQNLIKKKT